MAKIKVTTAKRWSNKYYSKQYEEFEDTKGVIRIRKSKMVRQYNGQRKKGNQRPTNARQKTKDREIGISQKPGEFLCSERVLSFLFDHANFVAELPSTTVIK
jgi:adenylate cyclase class IV